MRNQWINILFVALFCTACQQDVSLPLLRLVDCSPMPAAVAAGCYFTYDGEVYIFGGRTESGEHSNQLWKYSPSNNQWLSLGEAPLKARVSASACVVADKVYIGMGYSGHIHRDSSYLQDFWEYTPRTQEWKQLANFPANTTVKNCLFAADGTIYAMYGFYRQFTQDVYQYDIEQNRWEKLNINAHKNVPRAMDIVGVTCSGRHFLGTGFNHGSLRFWAEWHPTEQSIVACKNILGAGRNAVACCATEKYVYLAGGRHYGDTLTNGFLYNTVLRYIPECDEWEYVGSLPYKAENMIMVNVDNQVFIGLGETNNGVIQNNWYRFEE